LDIGSLMLKYKGGGHKTVGTCQVETDEWQSVRDELIEALRIRGSMTEKCET